VTLEHQGEAPHTGILCDGLTRSFGTLVAARDVSFEVRPGEVVGLLGPNGAGKTTTLRMLATLLKPSSGQGWVGGHSVLDAPRDVRAVLGYLTGDTGLYGRLSPREVLDYFGKLHGLDPARIASQTERLDGALGLAPFMDQRCETLSTGQRQRTSIARALIHDPDVLILDEPTSGLDLLAAREILGFFRAAADEGKAVLMSTHIMGEVALICDRAAIIHHGAIRTTGTLEELHAQTGASTLAQGFLTLLGEDDPTAGSDP
jgi:sodium transport system ATP-binding protein